MTKHKQALPTCPSCGGKELLISKIKVHLNSEVNEALMLECTKCNKINLLIDRENDGKQSG